jgi:hypothetical protein
MRLTVRQISSLLAFCVLAACAGKPPVTSKTKEAKFNYQKVYFYSYDNVWRAAQLSLKYPIAVNNMDHGILETDFIKADDGFIAPVEEKIPSSGVRYKITLTLSKGKVEGRESVRVTITKLVEKKRDFFAETETLVSDGLEEKVIFYRMERELVIDDALKKAAARGQ